LVYFLNRLIEKINGDKVINKTILITGVAGFIGMHSALKFLLEGYTVVGVDNINSYYDTKLKHKRLQCLIKYKNFIFFKENVSLFKKIENIFFKNKPNIVLHLAAQVGVRNSVKNPRLYVNTNINGFINILELCRKYNVKNLLYASSSSVYGNNKTIPFSETDNVDKPINIYAASKKANELMAYSYSHLYKINCIGLRFFTVYGPYGRPDMALFKFVKNISNGIPIEVYNNGKQKRDFTYIDDVVESIFLIARKCEKNFQSKNSVFFKIFNIGFGKPLNLMSFIKLIEKELSIQAKLKLISNQDGDMKITFSNTSLLEKWILYKPKVPISEGIKKFVKWYLAQN